MIRFWLQYGKKDLERIGKLLNTEILDAADEAVWAYVQGVRDRLVEKIENQEFDHAPLNPKYLQRKIREGKDTRILIATGEYIRAIAATRPYKYHYYVGIPEGATSSDGTDLRWLAYALEYGTKNMPARRHWRWAHSKVDREIQSVVAPIIERKLEKKLRRK